jgi:peptide chain release factor 3
LLQEGVVQSYELADSGRRAPLLGAVGPLQFEIVKYRLESEYGVASHVKDTPWTVARWLDTAAAREKLLVPTGACLAADAQGNPIILCGDSWQLRYFQDRNPNVQVSDQPFADPSAQLSIR